MKNFFLVLSLVITHMAVKAQTYPLPPNIDFETGSLTGWTFYTGTASPLSTPTLTGPIPGRHTLTSGAGVDYYGGFPVVDPAFPSQPTFPSCVTGLYSFKLGNTSIGAEAERARYTLTVPAGASSYHLYYRYALVLEDGPGIGGCSYHTDVTHKPKLMVSATDIKNNKIISCANVQYYYDIMNPNGFYFSLHPGSPAYPGCSFPNVVMCRNWATASIDLSGMQGQTIAIDFTTMDCVAGSHFGYAYIDFAGICPKTLTPCYPGSISGLTAPSGFATYKWYGPGFTTVLSTVQSPTTIAAPSVTTTYAVVATPHAHMGCADTFYVTVKPKVPWAKIAGTLDDRCSGEVGNCLDIIGAAGAVVSYTSSLWGPGSFTLDASGHYCLPIPAYTVSGSAPVTGTITLTSVTWSGCTAPASGTATVLINALPTATVSVSAPCTPSCPGQRVSVVICGTPGATVGYHTPLSSGTVTLPTTIPACVTINAIPTVEGFFSATVEFAALNNCVNNFTASDGVLIAAPRCDLEQVNVPCLGDPYSIKLSGFPGTYHIISTFPTPFGNPFSWTISSSSPIDPLTGMHYEIIGPFPTTSYSYNGFSIDQIDGCCVRKIENDHALCTLNIKALPVPIIRVSDSGPICTGMPFALIAYDAVYPYDWGIIDALLWFGPGIPPSTSTVPPPPLVMPPYIIPQPAVLTVIAPTTAGVYPYIVTAHAPNGCTTTYTRYVTVYDQPGPITFPTVCVGGTSVATDPTAGGTWSVDLPGRLSIDPSTGVATGLDHGPVTITYTMPSKCFVIYNTYVYVGGSIDTVVIQCGVGGTEILSSLGLTGGTWAYFDPIAGPPIVDLNITTGQVTGVAPGVAWISYITSSCTYYIYVIVPKQPLKPKPVVTCWATQNTMSAPYEWHFGFAGPVGVTINGSLDGLIGSGSPTVYNCCFTEPIFGYTITTGSNEITAFPPYSTHLWPTDDPVSINITSISQDGCTWADDCISVINKPGRNDHNDSTLGTTIQVTGVSSLTVIPNPNNGLFTLSGSIQGTAKKVNIEIIDMLGKTILTETAPLTKGSVNKQFSLGSNIANGTYFIKVKADGGSQVLRFTLDR